MSSPVLIRMKKDSIIWLSATPFLGIEVVRVLIRTDSLFGHDKMKNQFYKMSMDSIQKVAGAKIDLGTLQSLLIGNMPIPFSVLKLLKSDTSSFTFSAKNAMLDGNCVIDAHHFKMKELSLHDSKKNGDLMASFEDYKEQDGLLVPFTSKFISKFPDMEGSVEMNHIRLERSETPLSFPFKYE